MTDSKNVASNASNPASDSFLIAYGGKSVELRIMKDAISMYRDNFLEREKILEEEKQKLEELNYQVWSMEDSLCRQVWQFSFEHDFSTVFQYHPFVMACAKRRSNKDGFGFHLHALNVKIIPLDTERSSELIDLLNEIDVIKAEMIALNQGENIKREVESALTKLRKLQLISDDITELLRLIRPSESSCKLEMISMPTYDKVIPNNENKIKRRKNNSGHAEQMKIDKSDFTSKKKLTFTTPKNYPPLSLDRSVVYTANTFTTNEKFKTFTLKKRSVISIKLQECREPKQ